MPKLKICGLKRPEDIAVVNSYLPEYVGFVFAKSPRQITADQAVELRALLSQDIIPVGVFVRESRGNILSLVEAGIIDLVQLHGDEDDSYIEDLQKGLKQLGRGKIIKAVRVKEEKDIKTALDCPAEYLLFDTYTGDRYGGSGKRFNWQWLEGVKRPFFLAGGLNAENIREAVKIVTPYCVDVSSGVETDGVKDEKKIQRLVQLMKER
ncbi:MAG: phosphoribosylanthranilate isomerase [Lachnospiraceae bacterium]